METGKQLSGKGKKISEALRKAWASGRQRGRRGKKDSESHRVAISKAARLSRFWEKRPPLSEESKEKIRAANRLRWKDPEFRAKMIEAFRLANSRPEVKERRRAARALKVIPRRNSKPEVETAKFLSVSGVEFFQHREIQGARELGCFHVFDFVLPGLRTVVEADGCHWHYCQEKGCRFGKNEPPPTYVVKQKERDSEVNSVVLSLGWKIIRLWEHEIMSGDFSKLGKELAR